MYLRIFVIIFWAVWLPACQPSEPVQRQLSGMVLLGDNANVGVGSHYVIELIAADNTDEAMIVSALEGRFEQASAGQWPFQISYVPAANDLTLTLNGRVYAADGRLLYQGSSELVAGDQQLQLYAIAPELLPAQRTLVLECGAVQAVARLGAGELGLFLPGRYLVLSQQRTASGAHYAEGDVSLWLKGEEAMLDIGQAHYTCVNNRRAAIWEDAKLSGVSFRAVGNEPGWVMTMTQQHMRLDYVYGQHQLALALPEPEHDPELALSRYTISRQAAKPPVIIELRVSECVDTMSGERFSTQVNIAFDEVRLSGCGRSLH